MATETGAFELSRTPGLWTAFREQVWLLGSSRRWIGVTLSVLTMMIIIDVHIPAPIPGVLTLAIILLPVSAIWAMLVWAREGPNERGYHWSLPVPRPAHELARVAAGALYLLGMCGVLAVADALLSKLGGHYDAFQAISAQAWANYFTAPLVVYALVTPLVLWRDYAIVRWLLGVLFVLGVLTPLAETQHIHILSNAWQQVFFSTGVGLGNIVNGQLNALAAALGNPSVNPLEPWQTAVAVWLGIGLLLTVITAMFRPDDVRRIFRRGAARR